MTAVVAARPRWSSRRVLALGGRPIPSDRSGVTGATWLWFALSLVFAAWCGVGGLRQAFAHPYVVQDDARQYLFWMERFFDPELFPHDLMADYFSSVTPPAYIALHRVAAVVFGIDPFLLNKLLPIILGLITAACTFMLSMRLLPVPAAAFAATTILTESLWLSDAIPSGTERAFVYPLFLAFLSWLIGRRYGLSLLAMVLLGLFYPPMLAVALGTVCLSLIGRGEGQWCLARDRRLYLLLAGAVVASAVIVGWSSYISARWGPIVTAEQARSMREFTYAGRTFFFTADPWKFWYWGERSGVAPYGVRPPLLWIGLLLPVLARFPSTFPLIRQLSPATSLLTRVVIASLGLYLTAHALIFRLYLPNRYTEHSLRIVFSIAAGIVLLAVLDTLWRWLLEPGDARCRVRTAALAASGVAALAVIVLYPVVLWYSRVPFPKTQYFVGGEEGLYRYLERQPKDILVASLSTEGDLLPSFAKRSVLTGYEFGRPFHPLYYHEIERRTDDLFRAQYSFDPREVRAFIEKYGITYWLVDQQAFTRQYVMTSIWIQQTQPQAARVAASLEQPTLPVVAQLSLRCQAYSGRTVILLNAACLKSLAQD